MEKNMTWHCDPQTGDVYDHTGSLVANLVNDYGWDKSWRGEYPDEIETVMANQIEANSNIGSGNAPIATEYAVLALIDYLREDIQMGTPKGN